MKNIIYPPSTAIYEKCIDELEKVYKRWDGETRFENGPGLGSSQEIIKQLMQEEIAAYNDLTIWCDIDAYSDGDFYLTESCHRPGDNSYGPPMDYSKTPPQVFCPECGAKWMLDWKVKIAYVIEK